MNQFCDYGCNQPAKFELKNGKSCCSPKWQSCPKNKDNNSFSKKGKIPKFTEDNPAFSKQECQFCHKRLALSGLSTHEHHCYLNPLNIRLCIRCGKPIKYYRSSVTCSYKCSNVHFKDKQQNARDNSSKIVHNYRTIGLKANGKQCVVCGEKIAVCIHHHDGDHSNNDPTNLVPLCANHHIYWHSKHRSLIEQIVLNYLENRENSL